MKRAKIKAAVKRVRKAIAVAVAGVIVIAAKKVGVELVNEDVQLFVDFAFVTAAVYFAPANVKDDVEDIVQDKDEDGEV